MKRTEVSIHEYDPGTYTVETYEIETTETLVSSSPQTFTGATAKATAEKRVEEIVREQGARRNDSRFTRATAMASAEQRTKDLHEAHADVLRDANLTPEQRASAEAVAKARTAALPGTKSTPTAAERLAAGEKRVADERTDAGRTDADERK